MNGPTTTKLTGIDFHENGSIHVHWGSEGEVFRDMEALQDYVNAIQSTDKVRRMNLGYALNYGVDRLPEILNRDFTFDLMASNPIRLGPGPA